MPDLSLTLGTVFCDGENIDGAFTDKDSKWSHYLKVINWFSGNQLSENIDACQEIVDSQDPEWEPEVIQLGMLWKLFKGAVEDILAKTKRPPLEIHQNICRYAEENSVSRRTIRVPVEE